MLLGALIAIVGSIWFIVAAFSEDILWGLGVILLPFVGLIFIILHVEKGLPPFIVTIVGGGIMYLGMFVGGV